MTDPKDTNRREVDPREVEDWLNIIRVLIPPEEMERIIEEAQEEEDQKNI